MYLPLCVLSFTMLQALALPAYGKVKCIKKPGYNGVLPPSYGSNSTSNATLPTVTSASVPKPTAAPAKKPEPKSAEKPTEKPADKPADSESKPAYSSSNLCDSTHNFYRQRENKGTLEWDSSLEASATNYARKLAASNTFKHSGIANVGENLFMGTAGAFDCKSASQSWYNEKPAYGNQPIGSGDFEAYGHYTQMMWPSTKKLGCGQANGNGNVYIVCHYYPAGNVLGQKLN